MVTWIQTRWEHVLGAVHALTLIRFNLILGVICSVALYTGQGQDILRALVEVEPWHHNSVPKLFFLVFTISFACTAWYFARVIFALTLPREEEQRSASAREAYDRIKRGITRWIAPLVLLLVAGALIKAGMSYDARTDMASVQLFVMALILIAVGLVILFVVFRRRQWLRLDDLDPKDGQKFTSFFDLPRITRTWFGAINVMSVVAFGLFTNWAGIIGPWVGTAGILMLWATTLVTIGGSFVYLGSRYRVPVIGFMVAWVIACSWFNDNHRVRQTMAMRPYEQQQRDWTEMPKAILTAMVEMTKGIISRGVSESDDPFQTYFLAWFRDLETQWRAERHGRPGHDGPVPVVLVSAEGGGIRAAYWTAAVLSELQDRSRRAMSADDIPLDFARHVFAMSGVSGGSLGAAVFASMIKEQHERTASVGEAGCQVTADGAVRPVAQQILQQDFLSPTVGVLLFPDMFQRFVPWAFLDDRALALEQSWERAWSDCVGSNRFAQSFDSLWQKEHFGVPLLFLNSTVVETGQRIIMHPLPFAGSNDQGPAGNERLMPDPKSGFQQYFNNALDGPAVLGGNVPLSTAVHMSARFTYVSPAGTIFRQDLGDGESVAGRPEPKVIRVVDGGYFENSGAVTTDELLLAIRKIAVTHRLNIHPIVIHISNDPLKPDSRMHEEFTGPNALMPEVLSPIKALLNVRPARGYQAREALADRAALGVSPRADSRTMSGSFVHFQLCEYKRRLPLGWMLSELTREDMNKQLPSESTVPHDEFEPVAMFNATNLSVVLRGLAGEYRVPKNHPSRLTDHGRDCLGR